MPVNVAALKSEQVDQDELLRRVRPASWRNPVPKSVYDLAVLGGGPAGLAAAESAARQGHSVALIERYRLGGNSLNAGSIPSKAIIGTTRLFAAMRNGEEYGAPASSKPPTDFAAVMARMRRIRTRIAEYHSIDRCRAQGIDVFLGDARFVGHNALLAADSPLFFRKAIVATGARPRSSGIPGLEQVGYLTSETIFDLGELPARLGVIGGGPLGCESAQAFCRLGSRVTILQNDPKFLPHEERDAAELLSMSLSRDGVETRLNTTVAGAHVAKGEKIIEAIDGDLKYSIAVDEILLSIGRMPNVEDLDLRAAGIDCEPGQGIKVDDFLRTTNGDVYAAGDVCMNFKFTNVAETSARLAVQNALRGKAERQSRLTIPWCTYCSPEIAHIGMRLKEARERGMSVKSYTVMMQDVDRAITDGQDDGFVKVYVREGSDTIIGATIVAARASEMINEMSVIMSAGIGMRQLANIVHAYPAQSDAIRLAAMAYVDSQAISGDRGARRRRRAAKSS
jgi:pyruvate/2-oxoglutarate dehydrogenase complex dihydrolipoamide dehydrogenase (E3) component